MARCRIVKRNSNSALFTVEGHSMRFFMFSPSISKVATQKTSHTKEHKLAPEQEIVTANLIAEPTTPAGSSIEKAKDWFANALTAVLTTCLVVSFVWLAIWSIDLALTEFRGWNFWDLVYNITGNRIG